MVGKVLKIIEKSKSTPLILSFQNGKFDCKEKGVKRKINLTCDEKTGLRSVKVKLGDQEYEGNEENSVTGRRTFLAIRKASTGDFKMIELTRTAPLLNTVHKVEIKAKDVGDNFQARNAALQKMFGGKKGIRRIEKSEKFRLNAATNESSLLSTVKEMEVKEEADSFAKQINDSLAAFLPPCHRDATHVDQVYKLDELLGEELIVALPDVTMDDIPIDSQLLFTQSVVKALPSKLETEMVIAVAVIESLLRFIRMSMPEIRKRGVLFSNFEAIHNNILKLYITKNGSIISRSNQLRDQAVAQVIALAAALTKTISMDFLAKDTGYGKKKLVQLLRSLGCVQKERGDTTYILKLPLPPLQTKSKTKFE